MEEGLDERIAVKRHAGAEAELAACFAEFIGTAFWVFFPEVDFFAAEIDIAIGGGFGEHGKRRPGGNGFAPFAQFRGAVFGVFFAEAADHGVELLQSGKDRGSICR